MHETMWGLFIMKHNEHNILQWHGNVFASWPPLIHSSIWVPVFDDWVAFCEDGVQVWGQVCDSALTLFRTAGGTQIHCTHLRKGHREKWRTAANCLSIPLLVFVTTICYPLCHTGQPVWTVGCDLRRELLLCYINQVWVFSTCQRILCFTSLGKLELEGWWNYLLPLV